MNVSPQEKKQETRIEANKMNIRTFSSARLAAVAPEQQQKNFQQQINFFQFQNSGDQIMSTLLNLYQSYTVGILRSKELQYHFIV